MRLASAFLAALAAGACGGPRPPPATLPASSRPPHVVLVSFDGFRADYLERGLTPTFERVARDGARAAALVPVYPSKTFTNHYTIVTGLYADRHGLVANQFYDPERDEFYRVPGQTGVGDGTWYGGEPIWVTAERQGIRAGTMFWPGSEAAIGGVRPSYWYTFDAAVPDVARVDTVLAWLALPEPLRPRLVTLYFNLIDDIGHWYGPDSPELAAALPEADALLARLLDGIAALPGAAATHIVIVSDHGMIISDETLYVDDVVDLDGITALVTEPSASLWFHGDSARMDRVHAELSRAWPQTRVLRRSEIPADWHVADNPRIGDLLIAPMAPTRIRMRAWRGTPSPGVHGYEAIPEMRGILLALGPAILSGARIGMVENIHVYPLLAWLLGVSPAPDIDGRLEPLVGMLRAGSACANVAAAEAAAC